MTDKTPGWFQIRPNVVSVPLSSQTQTLPSQHTGSVPTASAALCPRPSDVKYMATGGPLSSEMKYPQVHAHGGTTRASYRRTQTSAVTVNRPPAAAANFSLQRKGSASSRAAERTFSTKRVGTPSCDYIQKRDLRPTTDWTAKTDLEYRV